MTERAVSSHKYPNVFEELFHKNLFCDAVLKVEYQEFPVHKNILCRSSEYFRALFERWAPTEKTTFPLGGLSPHIMSLLLQWIYTASVDLSLDTVQELLMAADMLLLDALVPTCFTHMVEHLRPDTCIGLWRLSAVVLSIQTRKACQMFILRHFEEVMVCEEFQLLTAEELGAFLEDDVLNVREESTAFQAMVSWIQHDLQPRKAHFALLLSKVRLAQIDYLFIKSCMRGHPLMDVQGRRTLHTATKAMMRTLCTVGLCTLLHPRLPESSLLAIGGMSSGVPTDADEAFNYKLKRWVNLPQLMETPCAYHGTVYVSGFIYYVGGFNQVEHFNSMRRLDLVTRAWSEMPAMHERRSHLSVTELNGRIYALGGRCSGTALNTAEVFDPPRNQWSLITPMNEKRSNASCAVLNGSIYICGGFNGSQRLQTAERYSADTNQWTLIAPMTARREGLRVVAFANLIYAVGGFDGICVLRSVEAYDVLADSWQQVEDMTNRRCDFGLAVMNKRIFAVGGNNGARDLRKVEAYDRTKNCWVYINGMDTYRRGLDCCLVPTFLNMTDQANLRPYDDF